MTTTANIVPFEEPEAIFILPIGTLRVDWEALFRELKHLNITKLIDADHLGLPDELRLSSVLAYLQDPNMKTARAFTDECLQHVSLSFMFTLPSDLSVPFSLALPKDSAHSYRNDLHFVTATLDTWVKCIVKGSNNERVRPIFNKMYSLFVMFGYKDLFKNYTLEDLGNGSLRFNTRE